MCVTTQSSCQFSCLISIENTVYVAGSLIHSVHGENTCQHAGPGSNFTSAVTRRTTILSPCHNVASRYWRSKVRDKIGNSYRYKQSGCQPSTVHASIREVKQTAVVRVNGVVLRLYQSRKNKGGCGNRPADLGLIRKRNRVQNPHGEYGRSVVRYVPV